MQNNLDRFKFRVWDGKVIQYNTYQFEFEKGEIMMQYTGLKDKNGKLICEGDVLKDDNERRREIVFFEGAFGYKSLCCQKDIQTQDDFIHLNKDRCIQFEIIGNKFENPELLVNEK